MLSRLVLRDFGLSFPISVTVTVDYKQNIHPQYQQQQQEQLKTPVSCSSASRSSVEGVSSYGKLGNNGGGSVGSSIVNTAFLFLYHIAWRLHGFLDTKKASFSSYSLRKTMEGVKREWRQFEFESSSPASYADDGEDFTSGCEMDGAVAAILKLSSLHHYYRAREEGRRGVTSDGGEYWHDIDT